MRCLSSLPLFSVCIACLFIAGCSQPGHPGIVVQPPTYTEQVTPDPAVQQTSGQPHYVVAVTAQNQDKNIIITYQGGTDTDKLLFITATVNGIEQSKKLGNTPGDTLTVERAAATDHVVIAGHFNDGSTQTLLDLDPNKTRATGEYSTRAAPAFRQPVTQMPAYTINPVRYY